MFNHAEFKMNPLSFRFLSIRVDPCPSVSIRFDPYSVRNRLVFLIWLLVAGMLFLLPGEGMAGSHGYSYRFDYFGQVDSDGDGGISWWEYRRYFPDPKIEVFALADENRDGFIDRYEWAQAIERFGSYFEDPPGSGGRHPDRPARKNRPRRPY